jgi:hypothetical protein
MVGSRRCTYLFYVRYDVHTAIKKPAEKRAFDSVIICILSVAPLVGAVERISGVGVVVNLFDP